MKIYNFSFSYKANIKRHKKEEQAHKIKSGKQSNFFVI